MPSSQQGKTGMAEGGGGEQATGAASGVPEALGAHSGTPNVFISYASQDAAVADAVVGALEQAGLRCWIAPRNVVPGEFYADAIVRAIDAAKVIVLVLSKNAVASPHVLREVERASSKRHPVVSLRIDVSPLPAALEYFLNTSHWLDASAAGVDQALPTLVDAVQRSVAPSSVVKPGHSGDIATPGSDVPLHSLDRIQASQRSRRPLGALVAVVAVLAAYLVVDKLWLVKRAVIERPVAALALADIPVAPPISDKSVAVLPFVDMSEKKDQEYFADGLSEELIDLLSKLPTLRVPARTSSFFFKGKSEDIPTIAKRLLVAYVLEGSVRKVDRQLRVTVQLVRADNGYHVWSETFDRKFDDVFKVQDEIAAAVIEVLRVSLAESPAPRANAVRNVEAYTLYLQARALTLRGTDSAAVDCLQRAIKLDPAYAASWAELAKLRAYQVINWSIPSASAMVAEAHQAADKALWLDPQLAIAYAARGIVRQYIDWDWRAAESDYRKALELEPRDVSNLNSASVVAYTLGNKAEARSRLELAVDLDPLNEHSWYLLGWVNFYDGRLTAAEAAWRKDLDLDPKSFGANARIGVARLAAGDLPAALALMQRETDEGEREWGLALVYTGLRHKVEADQALATLEQRHGDDAFGIAEVHAYRGERNQAFEWLERAYARHDYSLTHIKGDPLLRNLEPDPRYKALLRKMNVPE